MSESAELQQAREIGAKARRFYLELSEDKALQERFSADPLAVFSAHGMAIPAQHQAEFMAEHQKALAANESWPCKACKRVLYYGILVIGITAIAALVVLVAEFFEVAVAVAKEALEAALVVAATSWKAAVYLCALPVLMGPCFVK
jgi:hypothetical protein